MVCQQLSPLPLSPAPSLSLSYCLLRLRKRAYCCDFNNILSALCPSSVALIPSKDLPTIKPVDICRAGAEIYNCLPQRRDASSDSYGSPT